MTNTTGDDRDDIDARFAAIVSRWDESGSGAAGPASGTPTPETVGEDPSDGSTVDPAVRGGHPGWGPSPVPWRVHLPPEDDEDEGYVPPPPRALPPFLSDWSFYLALVGLVGGPLLLLGLLFFAPTERSSMLWAGGMTLAGLLTLFLRQPHERDPEDDDDGARV